MNFTIHSPAFASGQRIPREYTCEGDDLSPELRWQGAPPGAQSFVLIVDDPDAPDPRQPKMTYVHWVLYDIPANATGLARGIARNALPAGTREGINDWKRTGYGGPCPPIGRHRYFHKLYALNRMLGEVKPPTKAAVLVAMAGHVLAEAQLVGTYQKGD
jgi:Raf kinase inhibitor-like YbhB/YbcL family protein